MAKNESGRCRKQRRQAVACAGLWNPAVATYSRDFVYRPVVPCSPVMMRFAWLVLTGLSFSLSMHSAVAAESGELKSFDIVRIAESEAPRIDGVLDDAAWQKAVQVNDLGQWFPQTGNAAEPSIFYVMYDKDALYIGARLEESDPANITPSILRQGQRLTAEDRIWVILDTFNDKRNGYRFEVSVNGIRDDALYLDTTQTQWDWDGIYVAEASRDEHGWTAEMAIPFKTLSFSPDNTTWGINFGRFNGARYAGDGWVYRNRSQNAGISGTVSGLKGMDQGVGLDVVPSLALRKNKDFVAGTDELKVEPSVDAYYRLTPGLNAALTFNTDFSATEVDTRQVNLDRFSLFFPEKRGFFLRESDIFEFGRIKGGDTNAPTFARQSLENGRPFFSRSIGLSATGEPVDLLAGGKLSGRIGGLNVGALAIRQDAFAGVDAQNLFVGRVVKNVFSQSSLGVIATKGSPRSTLDSSLLGADFRYLNNRVPGGRSLEGELWVQRSDTEGLTGDDFAYGFRLRSPNNTGWKGGLGIKTLQANFRPAMGFLNRAGVNDYTAELGYTTRYPQGVLQSLFAGIDAEQFDGTEGGLQSRLLTIRALELTARTNDQLKLRYRPTTEVLRAPFTISRGVVLPVGEYSFGESEIEFTSVATRPLSVVANYRVGDFYSGERWRGSADVVWRASQHFWLTTGYEYNDVTLPQGDFIVRLMSTRFDVMFTSTWSWTTLVQYDNVSDSVALHSRLHWIPQAGRDMFIVFNHNLLDPQEDGTFRSTRTDATLKLNYTFRF